MYSRRRFAPTNPAFFVTQLEQPELPEFGGRGLRRAKGRAQDAAAAVHPGVNDRGHRSGREQEAQREQAAENELKARGASQRRVQRCPMGTA